MTEKLSNNKLTNVKTEPVQQKKYVLKKAVTSVNFSINYESELNKTQYEAAITDKGPILVIAGAGTGKTRTLVYRVARLVESGVKPEQILLLTFTRKSALEMLNRASKILDERCNKVAGGTFHSFANLILRKYADAIELKNSFVILDRSDAEDLMNLIKSKTVDTKKQRFPRKSTLCDIYSKAINKSIAIADVIEQEYSNFSKCTDEIIEICKAYTQYKKENSLLDYDDLLLYLKLLLVSNEKIRKKISETYKYIMVDEFQDTNAIQAEIIQLLAYTHNNVLAVGDDSQSIYSFRGADFKNIMNFPSIFDNTKLIKLEQNYRSTPQILNVANSIIEQAKEKYTKNLYTKNNNGDLPSIIVAPDQSTESAFIAQRILELQDEGMSLNDVAILARSSRSTYALEIELNKRGLPFKKFGGYKFVETAHIKDIISHLRVVVNNSDQISWNRILLLLEGIGSVSANKLISVLTQEDIKAGTLLPVATKNREKINSLIDLINTIRSGKLTPAEAAKMIIEYYHPLLEIKYDDFLKREKDIEHFTYIAENYNSIESFLSDMALEPPDSSFSDVEGTIVKDEYLTLSTIHSAKGLEWKAVFIMGTVEGKFPSAYSFSKIEDMEEERRLMYVASTRAKNILHYSYPIDMFDYNSGMVLSQPSRFLENINEDILEKWCLVQES